MKTFIILTALFLTESLALATNSTDVVAKISAFFNIKEQTARVQLALPKGVKFNSDGPWKLEISGPLLEIGKAKPQFDRNDFNKESGQFSFATREKITNTQANASKWKLVYFLCNEANTWCKRLTAEGEFRSQF
jgi:hypothetical protein